jgi:hypothetical protein
MRRKRKWVLWVILGFLVLAAGLFLAMLFPVSYYLPHAKPVLILPFDPKYDPTAALMPMGEKIYHPNAPDGHPGIDFGFNNQTAAVPYIAAMSGTITKVRIYANPEKPSPDMVVVSKHMADVVILNGPYQVVYSEMDGDSLPAAIRFGAQVRQGDLMGYGNQIRVDRGSGEQFLKQMIHWEFGSTSPVIDRFCPLTYFTPESRARIEAIWNQTDTPEMKARYPAICNGGYQGKAEK